MTKAPSPRTRTRAQPVPSGSADGQDKATPQTASKADKPDDYEVGFKKPPSRTRFRPGQSGNPKGRPKGSRNLKTELEEELQERIAVREGGARRTISKQRAMLKGLTAKAVQGDPRAANLVLNLVLRLLSQDEEDGPVDLKVEDQAILEDFERRIEERAIKRLEKDHGRKN
jgi:hypothetical protein